MITETCEKLKKLRMPGAIRAYQSLSEIRNEEELSNDEFLAFIVDTEIEDRVTRKIARLRKTANFKVDAKLAEVEASEARGLSKQTLKKLSQLDWVQRAQNIILCGATGSGKTFITNAIGHLLCSQARTTLYLPMNKLFRRIKESEYEKNTTRFLRQLERTEVLILDDFGFESFDATKCRLLFEIIDDRLGKGSTIVLSQYPVKFWPRLFEDKTIGDAIIDRIISNAIEINLNKGERSRRQKTLDEI